MRKLVALALSLPNLCFALQERPWFGDVLEFYFRPQYAYCFFKDVDRSTNPLSSTFFEHLLNFNLEMSVPETWDWQMELDFADTTPVSWGYRSFALQVRKLWLDDVCGDPVSLTTGFSYRDSSSRLRRALTTPFHARANFEFHTAVGKEWNHGCYWTFRTYGTFAVGQGTKGSPWLRGDLVLWWNFCDTHQLRLYGKSYWGLGNRTAVPIPDFRGWADTRHKSIDLGGSYRYQFECWGSLRFDYMHRVYARSYPERVNFFILTYDLPFCVF